MSPSLNQLRMASAVFIAPSKTITPTVNWFTLAPNSRRLLFVDVNVAARWKAREHAEELGSMLRRTANEFARSRTNVVKLFFTLARNLIGWSPIITPGSARWNRPAPSRKVRVRSRAFSAWHLAWASQPIVELRSL